MNFRSEQFRPEPLQEVDESKGDEEGEDEGERDTERDTEKETEHDTEKETDGEGEGGEGESEGLRERYRHKSSSVDSLENMEKVEVLQINHPELIQPTEVIISDTILETAEPVLTPMGR